MVTILLDILISAIFTPGVIAGRFEIAKLFVGKPAGDASATIELAAKLLLVGATFSDAVQSVTKRSEGHAGAASVRRHGWADGLLP